MTVNYEDCWAKTTDGATPGIGVRDHCLNAGCVAQVLAAGMPDCLRRAMPLGAMTALAALHDLGKVSPGFQQKSAVWVAAMQHSQDVYEDNHARVSQYTLEALLPHAARKWAEAVGAHHGRISSPHIGDAGGELWEAERRRLAGELLSIFGALPRDYPTDAFEWFAAGLIALSDWLASNEDFFSPARASTPPAVTEQRDRAERVVAALSFNSHALLSGLGFEELFPFPPNELQQAGIRAIRAPGVYVVEGAMGSGKTELALWAAYALVRCGAARGMYFALPTQTTSNRICVRVKNFVEKCHSRAPDVRLAHGTSWLLEDEPFPTIAGGRSREADAGSQETDDRAQQTAEARSWFASSRRALLSPWAVGTVDQALLGVVAAKFFFVRQYALAGKVVVLDEVHSYDLYTGTLIDELIGRVGELRGTVLILSATLTMAQRARLLGLSAAEEKCIPARPMITGRSDNGMLVLEDVPHPLAVKPVRVECVPMDADRSMAQAELCVNAAREGKCVAWIRNTVPDAQEAYKAVCAVMRQGEFEVGLLHARFPLFRRQAIEEEWLGKLDKGGLGRPSGCVLVATQVVEQSVDIDVDFLVTDIAPTDMLLQRIGRLQRHERPERRYPARVVVVFSHALARATTAKELRSALGRTGKVYAPYVLLRTLQEWRRITELKLPIDISVLLEATYREAGESEPERWKELRQDLERKKDRLRSLALSAANVRGQVFLDDDEGVQTRYSDQPQACVVIARAFRGNRDGVSLRLLDGTRKTCRRERYDITAARALHWNSVKVPAWWLRAITARTPPEIARYFPGRCFLAGLREDGRLLINNQPDATMDLRYTDSLGVFAARIAPAAPNLEEDDAFECCD